jgi:hypothetical protein
MASATIKRAAAPSSAGGRADAVEMSARDRRGSRKAVLALAAVCAGGLACFFAFPTYPTYDSLYALLWGRELLHLQLPDIAVYRAPTEHPLAIAFGAFCSLFGQAGARVMVLGSVASFVALTAGVHRLARVCFAPLVGVLAALLVLSRFFVENLALQGYLDVTYAALIVWGAALEAGRPRRGWPVLALLLAAGLLRPEAWLLSGVYWLWLAWRQPLRAHLAELALAALAPAVWMGLDTALTGDPLHSLHSVSGLAQELGRTQGIGGVLSSTWSYSVRIDKLAVVAGAVAGVAIALTLLPRLASRRLRVPLALVACVLLAFVVEGAAGASVLDRYMLAGAIALLPLCALTLGGWSLLERGSRLRRAWMLAAGALAVFGALQVNATLSLRSLRDTLAYHEQLDRGLSDALQSPAVRRALRLCPVLSLPNNKLIPDALWMLPSVAPRTHWASTGLARGAVVARSQARELASHGSPGLQRRLARASIAVYPLPVTHFFDAVAGVGEEPGAARPPVGFRLIFSSRSYSVYSNC